MKTFFSYLHTMAQILLECVIMVLSIGLALALFAPSDWMTERNVVGGALIAVFLIIEPAAWVRLKRKKEELENRGNELRNAAQVATKERDSARYVILTFVRKDGVVAVLKKAAVDYQTALNDAEMVASGKHEPPRALDSLAGISDLLRTVKDLHDRAVGFRYSFGQLRTAAAEEGIKDLPSLEELLEELKDPTRGNGR